MAKKSVIAREKKRARQCERFADKLQSYKLALKKATTIQERMAIQVQLQKLPRDAHPARRRARCGITGRARGVYKKFGVCRHYLRKLGMNGEIPGLTKSSW